MSEFLTAYREILIDPTSPIPLLKLHTIMMGSGGVAGLASAKADVKAMAEALAAALTD